MHNVQYMVLNGCVSIVGHIELPYKAENLAGRWHSINDETNTLGEHRHCTIRVRTIGDYPR